MRMSILQISLKSCRFAMKGFPIISFCKKKVHRVFFVSLTCNYYVITDSQSLSFLVK